MKSRSKALIWVVLVFLVGVGFGGATTFLLLRARLLSAIERVAGDGPSELPRREGAILRRMLRQLDLTPRQELQVKRILEDARLNYQQIQRDRNQALRGERRKTLDEIRKLLDPEQERKLDEFLLRLANRRGRGNAPLENPDNRRP